MLKVGDVAPDFKTTDSSLYEVLKEHAAVIFFFPKAFTPICTKEASAFGREFERFSKAGYQVFGISTDTQSVNDAFAESLNLPFPLLGDPDHEISRRYQVQWPLIGLARRVTFVVDPTRRVRVAHHREFSAASHVSVACGQIEHGESYHRGASLAGHAD